MNPSSLRFFVLGPVIMLLAQTLPTVTLQIIQTVIGAVYLSIGFAVIERNRKL